MCWSGVIHVKAMERGVQSELKAQVAHPFHKTCQTAAYKTADKVNHKHWSLLPMTFSPKHSEQLKLSVIVVNEVHKPKSKATTSVFATDSPRVHISFSYWLIALISKDGQSSVSTATTKIRTPWAFTLGDVHFQTVNKEEKRFGKQWQQVRSSRLNILLFCSLLYPAC